MNVTCKSCKTQYNVPITMQDFKCSCLDPFPSRFDDGMPECDCIEMPGELFCLSSCSAAIEWQKRVNIWIARDRARKLLRIK